MPFPTFTPATPPSLGTDVTPQIRLLKGEFGDGYRQRRPDGLNHIRDVYTLVWEFIPAEEALEIDLFLRARGGGVESFWYTPPGEDAPKLFTCEKWSKKRVRHSNHRVTAEFVQSFDLGSP